MVRTRYATNLIIGFDAFALCAVVLFIAAVLLRAF
jgi:hypothetical protein